MLVAISRDGYTWHTFPADSNAVAATAALMTGRADILEDDRGDEPLLFISCKIGRKAELSTKRRR